MYVYIIVLGIICIYIYPEYIYILEGIYSSLKETLP